MATPDADGRFTFSGLPPDQYRVKAVYEAPGLKLISPTADVTLETASNTTVSLNLAPGEEVSGTLEVEGGPASDQAEPCGWKPCATGLRSRQGR